MSNNTDKKNVKIIFQNFGNFKNFGPPRAVGKIEKIKFSWSYLESAHQKTSYQYPSPKITDKMSQRGQPNGQSGQIYDV